MSLAVLVEMIGSPTVEVLSTDLFDTVLLRDHTTETERLASACRRSAARLGVDAEALTRLRWMCHDNAYRGLAISRPGGDTSLSATCAVMATTLGLGRAAAAVLQRCEVETDIAHLRANRSLLEVLDQASAAGKRVIAVTDIYYSASDLDQILSAVVGAHPIARIYASADLGLTKHAGGIFGAVADLEQRSGNAFLHVGDSLGSDVQAARAAGWGAVHLPRRKSHGLVKIAGKARALPLHRRRVR